MRERENERERKRERVREKERERKRDIKSCIGFLTLILTGEVICDPN